MNSPPYTEAHALALDDDKHGRNDHGWWVVNLEQDGEERYGMVVFSVGPAQRKEKVLFVVVVEEESASCFISRIDKTTYGHSVEWNDMDSPGGPSGRLI